MGEIFDGSKVEVMREFPPLGKYRIRQLRVKGEVSLDVREYVSTPTFEGFTRRGIRIKDTAQLILLQEILGEVVGKCIVQTDPKVKLFKEIMTMPKEEEICVSCGIREGMTALGVQGGLCEGCARGGGLKYVFEAGVYPNQRVIEEKYFVTQGEAIEHAEKIGADHAYDCPSYRNPNTIYSTRNQCMPIYSPEKRKEVQMMTCTLCQREVPAAGPQSGVGYKEETLCGVCLKAAQRVCPHALKKEDGVTCRDCGARPWTTGRVLKGTSLFLVKAAGGIAKLFVLYTLQAVLGSAVTLGLAYFAAKKLGFLP